jgi:hypothetical protein
MSELTAQEEYEGPSKKQAVLAQIIARRYHDNARRGNVEAQRQSAAQYRWARWSYQNWIHTEDN